MKSKLLKLTSVLSAVAFMAVTLFTNPAQAELVEANDVVVDVTYDNSALTANADVHEIIYKCAIWRCEIDAVAE